MIRSALSSAALLGASIDDVLKTAIDAGVSGVEWSDDGFLEPGDTDAAGRAMMATLRSGLCTVSYSSLYRPGIHAPEAFSRVLATAKILQAPVIRLWAAPPKNLRRGEAKAFAAAARPLADQAGALGVTLCFGLSRGTVFDSYKRAADALAAADHPFIKLCWEPLPGEAFDEAMGTLSLLSGRIGLFSATVGPRATFDDAALVDGEDWILYLDAFDEQGGSPDMARHVVIRAFETGNPDNLAGCAALIKSAGDKLRRYRRRRLI